MDNYVPVADATLSSERSPGRFTKWWLALITAATTFNAFFLWAPHQTVANFKRTQQLDAADGVFADADAIIAQLRSDVLQLQQSFGELQSNVSSIQEEVGQPTWHLIAHQRYPTLFDASIRSVPVQNADDPSSDAYMIIGNLDSDSPRYFHNGKYYFKLVYTTSGGDSEELQWTQTSWLTAPDIEGFQASENDDTATGDMAFEGEGASDSSEADFDGNGETRWWWHPIGQTEWGTWNGITGIPVGSSPVYVASEFSLYIRHY